MPLTECIFWQSCVALEGVILWSKKNKRGNETAGKLAYFGRILEAKGRFIEKKLCYGAFWDLFPHWLWAKHQVLNPGGGGIFMQKISEVNYPIRQNFYFDSFLLQNYTMSQNLTSKALLDPLFPWLH